jgi:prevent-host-death family protein
MHRIGVRELRQHASRYLALAARGERVEVTDRGRPVAMLVPLRGDRWEDLLASGRVTPPSDPADVTDEAPGDYGIDASGTLLSMRDIDR